MKIKYSVIPFIPAFLAMLFLKVMSVVGVDGNGQFWGMNSMNISYTVIGIALGLFLVCALFNLLDRKTAPAYPVKVNPTAGFFAVLSGCGIIAAAVSGVIVALSDKANTDNLLMALICAGFAVPAGIAMLLISKVHFSGKSTVSSVSMLFVFPSLWGCANLVSEFLSATKASISSKDMTALFCYLFLALFLFSNSMVVSRVKGRNPVKGVFLYGVPMAALTLTFGAYELVRMSREGFSADTLIRAFMMIVLGIYALSFIVELYSNNYTKDDLEIVDNLPDAKEDDFANAISIGPASSELVGETAGEGHVNLLKETADSEKELRAALRAADLGAEKEESRIDDLVFSDRAPDNNPNVAYADDYYSNARGMDDFIMGYAYDDDKKAIAKAEQEKARQLRQQEKEERQAAKKLEAERRAAEKQNAVKQKMAAKKPVAEKPETAPETVVAPQARPEPEQKPAAAPVTATEPEPQPIAEPLTEEAQSVEAILQAGLKKNARSASNGAYADIDRLSEELRKAAESRKQSERSARNNLRRVDSREESKSAEELRVAEKAKQLEEARLEAAKKAEEARLAEEARKAEEARLAEEARKAEEARLAEEARKAEEARLAEEARKAEEARLAEEARKAEEARLAEIARRAEEARLAEEARKAEEERMKAERIAKAQSNPQPENIGTRQEIFRERKSAVNRLLQELNDKK